MTDQPRDAAVEAISAIIRKFWTPTSMNLDGAARAIVASTEAAVKSAVRTKDDAMVQVTDERDEIARLHASLTARLASGLQAGPGVPSAEQGAAC